MRHLAICQVTLTVQIDARLLFCFALRQSPISLGKPQKFFLRDFVIFDDVYVSMHVCAQKSRYLQRPEVSEPLKLE